jgi:hypothetical protein
MIEFDNSTRANFSKAVLKNFEGKAAQRSNGCLDSGQKGTEEEIWILHRHV